MYPQLTDKRTIVLIDGANFYDTMIKIGNKPDYDAIMRWLDVTCPRYTIYYYTAVHSDESGFNNLRKLLDWMEYRGIKVVTKPARTIVHEGRSFLKGNMDVEMTVDALCLASWVDHLMLFTGDGDQTYLVKELQRRGKIVTVVSCVGDDKGAPNFVADSLRRAADIFFNLPELPFVKAHK